MYNKKKEKKKLFIYLTRIKKMYEPTICNDDVTTRVTQLINQEYLPLWDDEQAIKELVNTRFERLKRLQADWRTRGEFVIGLNRTIRETYEENPTAGAIRNELREKIHDWCCDNLKGEELSKYLQFVD